MFARAITPRNPSFYVCESPRDSGKYRPQSADSIIYKRVNKTVKWRKSNGRKQEFILFGKAVSNNSAYDCTGVAALRCIQHVSNRSYKTKAGQQISADKIYSKHIVSKSQIKKYLKTRHKSLGLNNPSDKGIISMGKYGRGSPHFKDYTKHQWHCAGDKTLLMRGPNPASYHTSKRRRCKSARFSTSKRAVCTKKVVTQPLFVPVKAVHHKRKVSMSWRNTKKSDWRISENTPNTFNNNLFHNNLRK